MAGSCLYIATIGGDREGRVRLVKSMSREFELHGRDQMSLAIFTSFVLDWLQAKEIECVTLISSPASGGHMAGAATYKVEAALQLLPIEVVLVPSASITAFEKSSDETVPGPDRGRLGSSFAKLQHRAILAAAFRTAAPAEISPLEEEPKFVDRDEPPPTPETLVSKEVAEVPTPETLVRKEVAEAKMRRAPKTRKATEVARARSKPPTAVRSPRSAEASAVTPFERAAALIAML